MEEESLGKVHAQLAHGLELFASLNTLGNHHGALAVGKVDQRLDQVLLQEVGVDVRDQ